MVRSSIAGAFSAIPKPRIARPLCCGMLFPTTRWNAQYRYRLTQKIANSAKGRNREIYSMILTMKKILLTILLLTTSNSTTAHRGGLDSNGGHTNKSTGEYHCHRDSCNERNGAKKRNQQQQTNSSYNRKSWPHWVDEDKDCQNTRAEILIRDSLIPVKYKRNKGCNVTWGKWNGPYNGQQYTKASNLDIDHIVPLKHAHTTGAAGWGRSQKRSFANDPENLLTTSASANREKGAKGPARWKPPLKTYWCTYAKKWRHVKSKYRLTISVTEERSLTVMERTCY